jgi:probable F420-dependent oxidoreductase
VQQVKVGVTIFATEYAIDPVELARTAEGLGLESLMVPEHTHIPTSRLSPWPGGGELPREYGHTLDPFVMFGAIAAATERLVLGTAVTLVIERDPIVLAKQVATLDVLSGGRFVLGVGAGWNREEMANHGTGFGTRWKLLRERVEAMKAIWASDEAEYHGDLVDFDPIWCWPKPVQRPHPPILLGANGPGALGRVVRYCDGWLPHGRRNADALPSRIHELYRLAEEAGRSRPSVTVYDPRPEEGVFEQLEDLGVERVLMTLPSAPADELRPRLDRAGELQARFPVTA